LPRPAFLIAPPDDEGALFEPLLITLGEAAQILCITQASLRRLIDKRLVDVVHLGPSTSHMRVKTESLRRSFGSRVLMMRPERPFAPGTPVHLRPQLPGRSPPGAEPTAAVNEGAFISRRLRPADARPKPRRASGELVHDGAHGDVREGAGEPGARAAAPREAA
jgi:hypothetical protein